MTSTATISINDTSSAAATRRTEICRSKLRLGGEDEVMRRSGLLEDCVADAVSGSHDDVRIGGGQAPAQPRNRAFERVGRDVLAERIQRFLQQAAANHLL